MPGEPEALLGDNAGGVLGHMIGGMGMCGAARVCAWDALGRGV